jgi:hypothetical protein
LPELVDAAQHLVGGDLEYDDAVRLHFELLLDAYRGDRSRRFSFDGIQDSCV